MTEAKQLDEQLAEAGNRPKPLWPLAAVILLVVFTPALLAWGMSLLRH